MKIEDNYKNQIINFSDENYDQNYQSLRDI